MIGISLAWNCGGPGTVSRNGEISRNELRTCFIKQTVNSVGSKVQYG